MIGSRGFLGFSVSLLGFFFSSGGPAQSLKPYPTKPIRLVVGFAPGGGADSAARLVGQKLTELMGQPVVVDNRAGAGGNVAAEIVAKSAPDGYTLLFSSPGAIVINPAMKMRLAFDPTKDLAPLTLVASGPNVLVLPPQFKANSVKELIQLAATRPEKLSYASSGIGSTPFLSAELFKIMAKVDLLGVSYKGAGPAVIDLVAGRVDLMLVSVPSILTQLRAHRLKALAVTSLKRSELLPELPTLNESGLPGYEAGVWWGMLCASGTTDSVVNTLSQSILRALRQPEMIGKLAADGVEVVGSRPQEFGQFMRRETDKWTQVIEKSGIKAN